MLLTSVQMRRVLDDTYDEGSRPATGAGAQGADCGCDSAATDDQV